MLLKLEGLGHLVNWAPPPEYLIMWLREGARECAFQTSSQVMLMLLVCGHHQEALHRDSPWQWARRQDWSALGLALFVGARISIIRGAHGSRGCEDCLHKYTFVVIIVVFSR